MTKRSNRGQKRKPHSPESTDRRPVQKTAYGEVRPTVDADSSPDNGALSSGGHDESGLARAKTSWYFGDWDALAAIDVATFQQHPDRALLALLVCSAHQQLGDHDAARRYVRHALNWGCNQKLVAQILVAGVHNTLGRAAALARDDDRMAKHFDAAVSVGARDEDGTPVRHVRALREMARLELLPQAAGLLGKELAKTHDLSVRPEETRARIKVLETELDLLSHELSLAQQRQQLVGTVARVPQSSPDSTDSDWLAALSRQSVSQLGQDLWVLEKTGYKRGGFFVEFGATDGVLLNNSYLLEREFGWRGICAEPNPKFFQQLQKNRTCISSDACIAGETGVEVEFIFADAYGGMAKHAGADMHAEKRTAYATAGKTARLQTISLNDFLKRYDAPCDIDYLSIDTEGSELEILSSFPFDKWNISLITVEHNFTSQRIAIRELLLRHGFVCTEREWDDWYARER